MLTLLFLFSVHEVRAAQQASAYSDFVSVCSSAFARSAGLDAESGKKICECTAQESKHQGLSVAGLEKETVKIKKDPKYKIADKKLLASFQYCTVLSYEEFEHSRDR